MGGANFKQKNLLKDLIYLGQTRPVNKQTVKGLFRFALEPLLEAQSQKALVLIRTFETTEIEGVLKRLEFTNAEVYSFDNVTKGENLQREDIWEQTEFLVVLSPRYSVVLLWDYSTESVKNTSCLYYLLNSRDVNKVISIINSNSKIDLMRYTQEYTPERRENELLNKAVHKFIDYADSFVEEANLSRAENAIIGENDDITQKYEYIASKTKTISHDIRNHLSVIDLYTKIIEKRLEIVSNKELQDSLTNAVASINKSKDAITHLLNDMRSIQGVNLQTHSFSNILESVVNMAQAKASEHNIQIEVSNPFSGEILADENKFLNVLINLIYNAIDAIGNDGCIKLNVYETSENMLAIQVCDSGSGIDDEIKTKIFEEGFTSKNTGTGLGLYISKEAMKEQYGDLNLVSSRKGETIFEITIPRL